MTFPTLPSCRCNLRKKIATLNRLITLPLLIKFSRAFRRLQIAFFYRDDVVKIEIDKFTVLPDVGISDLLTLNKPARTIVVPEAYVEAKAHRLSKPSSYAIEQKTYDHHTFRAPELLLERLQDQYWFPQSGFLVSKLGKVWRHSVLGQYGDPHFLTTHAVEERISDDGKADYLFYEHLLHKAPIIEGPYLITSHYASHNYGHFMLDMVPLIQLGMTLGLRMASRPLLDWQKAIYWRVGINPSSVSIFSEHAVFLKEVFVSNRHNAEGTYAASPNLREVFAAILQNVPQPTLGKPLRRRIFLSRGVARSRRLRNRAELEKMLRHEGFEIVQPETLSFDEQAILFSQADIIVSEFGALMANVVFCRPETKIVEIIPEDQNDPWSRHLCASMGLEHVTLFHKVRDEDREAFDIAGRIHKNIYFQFDADIDLIRNVLNQV